MIQAGVKMRTEVAETTPLLARSQEGAPRGGSGPRCWRVGLVEPVAVIYLLSNGYMSALRTQFLYSRVADQLGINKSLLDSPLDHCSLDSADPAYQARQQVQDETAMWTTYLTLAKLLPMVISTLYFGSLSDKLGRKMCMLLPVVGCVIGVLADMMIDYFHLPLGFFFLEVLEYFFGGNLLLKLGCSAFIADTVSGSKRSIRMTVLDSLSFSSTAVSSLLLGLWLKYSPGYFWVFSSVFGGNVLCFLYTFIFIPSESLSSQSEILEDSLPRGHSLNQDGSYEGQLTGKEGSGLSIWQNLWSSISVYTKDDGSGRRWKLNILLISFFISALSATGHVITLYEVNTPLCWDAKTIGLFNFEDFFLKALMMVVVVYCLKQWLNDDWLALSGRVSSVIEHVYLAFCVTTPMMFAAPVLGCLNLLTEPMTKSLMTSLVHSTEQGSLLAVFSLAPVLRMASGAVMAPIYAKTLSILRGGVVFLLSASLHLISLGMIACYIWRRRRRQAESLQVRDHSAC